MTRKAPRNAFAGMLAEWNNLTDVRLFRSPIGYLLLLLVLHAQTLLACSCASPGAPAQQFASADVVFRGTVTARVDRQTVLRRAWTTFLALIGRETDFAMETYARSHGFEVEFSVERMWRGPASREMAIFTGRGGGDCGVPFEVGKEYLVYGWCDDEDDCFSIICSRTSVIENAAEDLRYLASRTALRLPPK